MRKTRAASRVKLAAIVSAALALYLARTWDVAFTPSAPLAELTIIDLNGQPHYASIRSRLPDNVWKNTPPVLLILHGGPGDSSLPHIRHTDALLEERFVVVNYDQRSAGKSCRFFDFHSPEMAPLTVRQHVQDVVAMIEYLRKRFGVEKVFLLGGSWGSKLALLVARDYPSLLHHVAVRGLAADTFASEQLSNTFIAERFPDFVPKGPPYGDRAKDLKEQRSLLYRAGGMTHRCSRERCSKYGLTFQIARTILTSKEMSWSDIFRFRRCFMLTLERMWPEVEALNITKEVTSLEVPLLVLHGRHDHNTAHELVPNFLNALQARNGKRLVWFEESAHSPQQEEPSKFQETLVRSFLDHH